MDSPSDPVLWSNEGQNKLIKTGLKFTNILQWAIYEKYGLIQCILKIKREFSNVYLCISCIVSPEIPWNSQAHGNK